VTDTLNYILEADYFTFSDDFCPFKIYESIKLISDKYRSQFDLRLKTDSDKILSKIKKDIEAFVPCDCPSVINNNFDEILRYYEEIKGYSK